MDYARMTEQTLDEIMRQIRLANGMGPGAEKSTGNGPAGAGEHGAPEDGGRLAALDELISQGAVGTQIGLSKAPMYKKKGVARALARLVEKIYLRVSVLTNRDIREFNRIALSAMSALRNELSRAGKELEQAKREGQELQGRVGRLQSAESALRDQVSQLEAEIESRTIEEKIDALDRQVDGISQSAGEKLAQLEQAVNQRTGTLLNKLNENEVLIRRLDGQLSDLRAVVQWANVRQPAQDAPEAPIVRAPEADPLFYHDFQERFRGAQEDIRERLEVYIPVLREQFGELQGKTCVDLGCGRGEWLDLLMQNGAADRLGVDTNEIQLNMCREKGHPAVAQDCVAFLAEKPEGSVDLITAFHMIEHLPLEALLLLLRECFRVLRPQGMILLETPNPGNLIVAATNFYTDPTHVKPIHQDMARFLMERTGFADVRVMEVNPARYLRTLMKPVCFDGNQPVWEENIDILNRLMYGPQDYAVLGVKP